MVYTQVWQKCFWDARVPTQGDASGRVLGSGWPTQGPAGRGVGMLYRHIASFAIE